MKLRVILVGIFILMRPLFGFEIEALPKDSSLPTVFGTNCLQMTNSQQILETYIMIGLKSNFDNPKKNLSRAIPRYDSRIHQISDYFQSRLKDENAKKAFDEAIEIWNQSKAILEKTPTKQGAVTLKKNFRVMIKKLLVGSKPLADEGLELLSLTGKLCRAPLEISIDYLMKIWKIDMPDYDTDVQGIIAGFKKHLAELSQNKLNNDESRKLLKKSENGFKYFEFMYNSKLTVPSLLYKKANDNFDIIRAIKREYKKQVN